MHVLDASSTVYKPDLARAWADSGLGRCSQKGCALGIANGPRTHAVQAVDTVHAPDNVLGYDLAGPLHMPGTQGSDMVQALHVPRASKMRSHPCV